MSVETRSEKSFWDNMLVDKEKILERAEKPTLEEHEDGITIRLDSQPTAVLHLIRDGGSIVIAGCVEDYLHNPESEPLFSFRIPKEKIKRILED